jgi:hypothetical protein
LQGTGGIYQGSSRNINIGAGGVVRPGTNGYAGALGFAKLTHSSGATNIFNLVSTSVYGQIVAIPTSGTATINLTNAKIVVNDANGTFAQNDVVTIVSIGSYTLSGTYSGQAQGSTVSGSKYNWTISYTGGAGHDVTLTRQ